MLRRRFFYFAPLTVAFVRGQGRQFEAVSVRYAGAYDSERSTSVSGGPGSSDPAHIIWENLLMLQLLSKTFGGDFDQIEGPAWLATEQYTIRANLPPNTTKEELSQMLQDMLVRRFHLAFRRDKRDFPVYELTVAKGGPKMQKSAGDPGKAVPGARVTLGSDHFPVLPPGRRMVPSMQVEDGAYVTRETFRDFSMEELVQDLAWPLAPPRTWAHGISVGRVINKTGLDGRYDFKLYYAGTHDPQGAFLEQPKASGPAPTLFDAVQLQLGLRLNEAKAPLDVVVIEHLDKLPIED